MSRGESEGALQKMLSEVADEVCRINAHPFEPDLLTEDLYQELVTTYQLRQLKAIIRSYMAEVASSKERQHKQKWQNLIELRNLLLDLEADLLQKQSTEEIMIRFLIELKEILDYFTIATGFYFWGQQEQSKKE